MVRSGVCSFVWCVVIVAALPAAAGTAFELESERSAGFGAPLLGAYNVQQSGFRTSSFTSQPRFGAFDGGGMGARRSAFEGNFWSGRPNNEKRVVEKSSAAGSGQRSRTGAVDPKLAKIPLFERRYFGPSESLQGAKRHNSGEPRRIGPYEHSKSLVEMREATGSKLNPGFGAWSKNRREKKSDFDNFVEMF